MDKDFIKRVLKKALDCDDFLDSVVEDDQSQPPAKKQKASVSPLRTRKVVIKAKNRQNSPQPDTSSSEVDNLDMLERQIIQEQGGEVSSGDEGKSDPIIPLDSDEEEEEHDPVDSDDQDELQLIGDKVEVKWLPKDSILAWFKKAADIELKPEDVKDLRDKYEASEDIQEHFMPPRLPEPFWNTVNARSHSDTFKAKSIYKSQDYINLAIKPLLSALESCPKETKSHLLPSIQLLCSANLQLSRLRRATCAPYIKKDLKKQLLSTPVTHSCLFGDSFEKTSESVIKESSTMNKFLENSKPSSSRAQGNQTRRGNFRGHARGKENYQQFPGQNPRFPNPQSSHYRGSGRPNRGQASRGFRGRGGGNSSYKPAPPESRAE